MQVYNVLTQQLENVTWSLDGNSDFVATFADGSFLKFPGGSTQEQLQQLVTEHQAANEGKVVFTPEQVAAAELQREADQQVVNSLNGDTSQGVDTNASIEQPAS